MGPELISFFIVILAGTFFSVVFARLHLPWVVALIIGGVVIGPDALGIFQANETFSFLADIGLIFLMFMAGLETRLSTLPAMKKELSVIVLLNGGLPFLVGLGIGWYFGFGLMTMLLLGIIFISSSIAVVVPSLEANNLIHKHTGQSIVAATVFQDIASLVLLSILLQTANPVTALPLPLFYILLFGAIVGLRKLIVAARNFFKKYAKSTHDLFQQELRSVFVILIGTVVVFELLGLHPIIGGFFAGLVLSGTIQSSVLKGKLRAISYGIFIPIFFVIIGSQTNLAVFADAQSVVFLTGAIVIGSILAKFVSGLIAGAIVGRGWASGALIGAATIPQLSTTLAVAATGFSLGIFDQSLVTALVILSIVTTLVGPLLVRMISRIETHRSFDAPHEKGIKGA